MTKHSLDDHVLDSTRTVYGQCLRPLALTPSEVVMNRRPSLKLVLMSATLQKDCSGGFLVGFLVVFSVFLVVFYFFPVVF